MTGWTVALLTGWAEYLAAAGVGAWRPDGSPYELDETAITFSTMPPRPDRVICLRLYPVRIEGDGDVMVGVQVRTRAGRDPREVADLADQVFDVMDGLAGVNLGGVWVSQVFRRSGEELGADVGADQQADRCERVDNYYVQAARPSVNREP